MTTEITKALTHLTRCAANQRDGIWSYINGLLERINR